MFESLNFFNKPNTSRLSGELDQLSKLYLNPISNQKIKKAVDFADKAHEGQFRKSGEPFISISELVATINEHFGSEMPTLVKAGKQDLQKLVDAISQ